jgi:hypothetical protein
MACFVGSAIQCNQRLVDLDLQLRIHSPNRIENLAIDRLHGLGNAFAEIALTAVAQLNGLMRSCGSTGRNRGAALETILQNNIHLDGGIAAAVEDLAANDVDNRGHGDLGMSAGMSPRF